MSIAIEYRHIIKSDGEPARLQKTPRIRVAQIVMAYQQHAGSIDEACRQFAYLTPAEGHEGHAAMVFYPRWGYDKRMPNSSPVQRMNQELARQINDEARRDPQSPYAGKFVGIANGQVAVIADSLDELAQRLRQAEPDVSKTMGIEAGLDYDAVQHIWTICPCRASDGA